MDIEITEEPEYYQCSKGHRWKKKINCPQPIKFAIDHNDDNPEYCPLCLQKRINELLKDVGTMER
jgi:hypothetical protein